MSEGNDGPPVALLHCFEATQTFLGFCLDSRGRKLREGSSSSSDVCGGWWGVCVLLWIKAPLRHPSRHIRSEPRASDQPALTPHIHPRSLPSAMVSVVRIALLLVLLAVTLQTGYGRILKFKRTLRFESPKEKLNRFVGKMVDENGLAVLNHLEKSRAKLAKLRRHKKPLKLDPESQAKADTLSELRMKDDPEPVDTIESINHGLEDFLYDGDMMLNPDEPTVAKPPRSKRQAIASFSALWDTEAEIPYSIDTATLSNPVTQQLVRDAIAFWQNHTCLKFKEDPTNERAISFYKGVGCSSYVGRVSSVKQEISIGDRCEFFGIIAHELAHALGVYHHQSRKDRDDYITVLMENVEPTWQSNMAIQQLTTNYGTPYEYGSSLHYAEKILESDKVQILAKDSRFQRSMGNRNQPTFNDVLLMNRLYACDEVCDESITCVNGGYPNPAHCDQCLCPAGFGGKDCSDVGAPENGGDGCGGALTATNAWQTLTGQVGEASTVMKVRQAACHWHIKAPAGSKIDIEVQTLRGPCSLGCFYGATEVKLGNFTLTGIRMCCSSDLAALGKLQSDGNLAIVSAYSQLSVEKFILRYKISA